MVQNSGALEKFKNTVGIKFQLYNSLFLSLPFYGIDKTGILLSLFNQNCEEGFAAGKSPSEIIAEFFENHAAFGSEKDQIDLLFRFVQYAERQIVLFDALEDASFRELNDMQGAGTMKQLETAVMQQDKIEVLSKKLEKFAVRLVLTAHPTQFYPGPVLGIINDLVDSIAANDVANINSLLQQLGRTPFLKKQKPTPYDEAVSLIWYLENIFYNAVGNVISSLKASASEQNLKISELIKMGFWSGGDRDGNPFVTVETTVKVAEALRRAILHCYYRVIRVLKRRLTFAGVESILAELERRVYRNAFSIENDTGLKKQTILDYLYEIQSLINTKHSGLFVELVDRLIDKVELFGLFFATIDIRQDSGVHANIFEEIAENTNILPKDFPVLSEDEKINVLLNIDKSVDAEELSDE